MPLRPALNYSQKALKGAGRGVSLYSGAIVCTHVAAAGDFAVCDLGGVIDDLLAVKVLSAHAASDKTGVEIILSDVDPSGWTRADLQNHVIEGAWRYPLLIRNGTMRRNLPLIPDHGAWRYLSFFNNPDSQATGNFDISVICFRSKAPSFEVVESVAIV